MPLEPDLSVSLDGFTSEKDATYLGSNVLSVVKVLHQHHHLNISKLRKIVVCWDFPLALQKVKAEYNHESPVLYTNSKQATALGQLVSKTGSDGLCSEYTLVLSVNFFAEWFDENGVVVINDNFLPIIHRLHHELVHVHERNTLTGLDQSFRVNVYDDAILISATRAWSEYLANFVSSPTAHKEAVDGFLEQFETVLNEVPSEIDSFVLDYLNNKITLDVMFQETKKRVKLIINSYAYALGYIHGIDIDLQEHFPTWEKALAESKLNDSLSYLGDSFDRLMEKYKGNKIDSYSDFDEASAAVNSVFKAFKLNLVRTDAVNGSDLYIYVQ